MIVRGQVRPGDASVLVAGREADASGGLFEAEVPLEPGANVIDIAASADGRRAAVDAVRVVREVPIVLPDVTGEDPGQAEARLRALGLEVETRETGGPLDELLPLSASVCSTDPEPGATVRAGETVVLDVAKLC